MIGNAEWCRVCDNAVSECICEDRQAREELIDLAADAELEKRKIDDADHRETTRQ